jgi:hypothetical protein
VKAAEHGGNAAKDDTTDGEGVDHERSAVACDTADQIGGSRCAFPLGKRVDTFLRREGPMKSGVMVQGAEPLARSNTRMVRDEMTITR